MSAKIEFRKCTICHESFGWNGIARCVCNECKKQSALSASNKRNNRNLFIVTPLYNFYK